jgi:YebC/PmpR family DNA-binding regulatory protein
MSGHSRWSTIKRKKTKEDQKKGRMFSKMSQKIIIAAREGGGNPDTNPALATAIENARGYSMPVDSIKRAIKKGTGELVEGQLEQLNFEGYGEGGVAILVEVLTDNRNRTTSEVRHVFSKYDGHLGEMGSVAWLFEKKGVFLAVKTAEHDEDELLTIALEAGADDLATEGEYWEIVTDVEHFKKVKDSLAQAGIQTESEDLTMVPKSTVPVGDRGAARKVLRLVESLEEVDDVTDVYANFDIPDDMLQEEATAS